MVFVAGLSLLSLPVSAQTPAPTPAAAPAQVRPTGPDQALVGQLHQLGRDAITTAQLAEDQAVNGRVRSFAQTVRLDQSIANDALQDYGMRKNMNMNAVANPGDALPHGVLANAPLVNSPRDEFDYRFMSKVMTDQQGAMDAGAAAQRLARDPELKGLIGRQLAMLSSQQAAAQQLLAQIPAPEPRAVLLPAFPAGASRTQTGADLPPPEAVQAR
jgi:predicted outer membrane protein